MRFFSVTNAKCSNIYMYSRVEYLTWSVAYDLVRSANATMKTNLTWPYVER